MDKMILIHWLLLLLYPVLARGTNSCLDPASDVYKCSNSSGSSQIMLDGCGIVDDDLGDIATCMDDFGRDTITRVYLRYNELATLRANLFAGLVRLERMYVSFNLLTTLPATVFNGLERLEWLSLDSNSLAALPDGIFQELGQLELLWLDNNSLTTLPSEIFSDLGALQEVFLRNNPDLQCVPSSSAQYVEVDDIVAFEECGCTPIGAVACDDNAFCMPGEFGYSCATSAPSATPTPVPTAEPSPVPTSMPTNIKNPCLNPGGESYVCNGVNANETELNLDYCGMENTDMGDVETCLDALGRETMTRVSMRFNYLTALPKDIFHGMGHVEKLYLSNNALSSLPAEILQPLGKLKILDLNGNSITHLSAGLFQGLGQLQELRINSNLLTTLPAELFDGLRLLEWLDLRMNPELQCVPQNVAETVDVNELASHHGCRCSLVPTTAMCDARQACAPGEFGYTCMTPALTPAPFTFTPGNNTCLDPVSDDYRCNTPGGGATATQIDFSFCGITDDNLEGVSACLDVFGRGALSHLHLSYNFLTRLQPDLFQGCGRLEHIYLNDNELTTLPEEVFQGVGNLKVLNLNRNSMVAVPGAVFRQQGNSTAPGQLQELLLNMNDLTTLPADIFEDIPLLEELDLRLNPGLQCIPNNNAANVDVDDDFSPDTCRCDPAQGIACSFGEACVPGELGHICFDV